MYNTAVLMFQERMGLAPQYVCDVLNKPPARHRSNNCLTSHTHRPTQDGFCILWVIGLELFLPENKNVQVCAWF